MSPSIGDDSAAERNKRPIFDALEHRFANVERLLEVGSGDGVHAGYARRRLPHLIWQTSEAPARHRRLVAALADHVDDNSSLPVPLVLDVRRRWPDAVFDAVFGANVAHIMSWAAVESLFEGAGQALSPGGWLCLYGPFAERGRPLAPGNADFDRALRARDADMGLREIEALDELATAAGLAVHERLDMPKDNRLLFWRRG